MVHWISAVAALAVVLLAGGDAAAQRARTVSDPESSAPVDNTMPAPQTVKVKYEGGIFGYNKKLDGTLSFDEVNQRLLFREKNSQQVVFFVPYRGSLLLRRYQSRGPTGPPSPEAHTLRPRNTALFIKRSMLSDSSVRDTIHRPPASPASRWRTKTFSIRFSIRWRARPGSRSAAMSSCAAPILRTRRPLPRRRMTRRRQRRSEVF